MDDHETHTEEQPLLKGTLIDMGDAVEPIKVNLDTDFNRAAYWIMMLLGVGLLLPWNVALNSLDYMGHNYSFNLSYYVTLAYVYPQLPLLAVMVKYGNRLSYTFRITAMFFLEGACMLLMAGFAPFSYWITLVLVFIIGLGTAVLQSSLFGFASQFPAIFNQSLMAGQGLAGIVASVLRIFTKGSMNSDLSDSALLYFALVTVVMIACIVGYIQLLRMPFTIRILAHTGHSVSKKSDAKIVKSSSPLVIENGTSEHEDSQEDAEKKDARFNINYWELFKKIWVMAFCEMAVFTVTFAVFPGEITSIKYHSNNFLKHHDWWSVMLFFIFNIFDTIGRYAPGAIKVFPEKTLWIPSLLRIGFIPLFIGSVYWGGIFQNDVFTAVVMLFFSLTNGYIASLGMMYGPARVEPHERETAGFILSFFLQFGIFVGSQVALGVKQVH